MTLTVQDYRDAVQLRREKGNAYDPTSIVTYEYWAKVEKVVDGDTLDLLLSLGFDCQIKKRCRLFGINAPEFYSSKKGTPERIAGEKSKQWLENKLPENHWIEVRIFSDSPHDKYGRWLVEVHDKQENINESLVSSGHAKFAV